jgi:hypothetical protein
MRHLIIAAILVCAVPVLNAQGRRGGGPSTRVAVESDLTKGAPYSAEVVSESLQTLPDGNRIIHQRTSRVYRDGQGRTRREEDRPSGSPAITISDPVAGSFWTLDVDARVARQSPAMPFVFGGTVNRNGEFETLRVIVDGQLSSFIARGGGGRGFAVSPGNEQHVEEQLSDRTIEGLRVQGVRRTTTIPAGAIGNERAIVVTSDEWTSPDLKVLVLSESSDPRTGTSTYKLVNVKRGDPPASLFQVPADYTTEQAPTLVGPPPQGRGEGRGEGRGRGARGGAPQQ